MTLTEIAARWLLRKYGQGQTTYCFCPGCGIELCGSAAWYNDKQHDIVRYKCLQCGIMSGWLFDVPVPILVEHTKDRRGDK